MNTLRRVRKSSEVRNKRAQDPFDQLVFEKGLRVKHVLLDKKLNLMVVVVNNGTVIKSNISSYQRLKNATEEQLNKWSLIGDGVGIEWPDLDEDLSLKGFIKTATMNRLKVAKGNPESLLVP